MYTNAITIFFSCFLLAATNFLPGTAHAQTDAAQPAVDDVASKPIGKVVTATGSVTIEHVNAAVIQANLGGQIASKVGDLVYQGYMVGTGSDGLVSINFSGGTSCNVSRK